MKKKKGKEWSECSANEKTKVASACSAIGGMIVSSCVGAVSIFATGGTMFLGGVIGLQSVQVLVPLAVY